MADPTDLSEQILDAATSPQSASADGQSATSRSVPDLVLADQYLAAKAAAKQGNRGLAFTKLIPPGALSDCGRSCDAGFNTLDGCG